MFFKIFHTLINFQSYINKNLIKNLDIFIIIYLNNTLIYNKNFSLIYIKIIN